MTRFCLICLLVVMMTFPARTTLAEPVSTMSLIALDSAESDRERLAALVARDDVRGELERFGVDPSEAAARVAALSDTEVESIVGQIDSLAAGAGVGGVLVVILLVLLILLVMDLAGVTDIFPAVDPAN